MLNKNKLIWPVAIVIASLVLGGAFYMVQINKQQSIERQQKLEIEQKEAELLLQQQSDEREAEQTNKEYIASRKSDCLDIYNTEQDEWSNVQGWRYDEVSDRCYIRYKDKDPKTDAQCDETWPVGGDSGFAFFMENSLCKSGEFENSF